MFWSTATASWKLWWFCSKFHFIVINHIIKFYVVLHYFVSLSCSWLVELLFFIEAFMMLYYGFVMKPVLKTPQCCSCCRAVLAESQGFFCFWCCPEMHKELGEDMARTVNLNLPKQYPTPHEAVLSNKIWGEGKWKWRSLERWHLSSQETLMCDEAPF